MATQFDLHAGVLSNRSSGCESVVHRRAGFPPHHLFQGRVVFFMARNKMQEKALSGFALEKDVDKRKG